MRTKRKQSAANLYHIMARGSGRQMIFEDEDDRHLLHALLHSELPKNMVENHGWCFMGNHIHLVLRGKLEDISSALKTSLGTYAMAFNRKYNRPGHLFQERFKSEPINDDSYLLTVIRYIHQNPLKAGLSCSCSWPWSSYEEYLGISSLPPLCNKRLVLELLGGIDGFASFHETIDSNCPCIDITEPMQRSKTKAMPDEYALLIARQIIGPNCIKQMRSWSRKERNTGIIRLKEAGLTNRQIERLTGIGRGIIDYASKNPVK